MALAKINIKEKTIKQKVYSDVCVSIGIYIFRIVFIDA